jgi:glyoxalase family protein
VGACSAGTQREGLAEETAFRVPAESIGYWTHRFIEKGVPHRALEKRFGESVLPFSDPDGMSLAQVGVAGALSEAAWSDGTVAAEHAIRGFHGVTLMLEKAAATAAIVRSVLGFKGRMTVRAAFERRGRP